MIIIVSPAKTFNKNTEFSDEKIIFNEKFNYLFNTLKTLDKNDLEQIMKISKNLANNAFNYYKDFNLNIKAISLYGGQAFKYLNYQELNNINNLYILSPLYGLLNANSAISKYRLDLKDNIINQSLTNYWYDDINNYLKSINDKVIINLSSGEFSNLLDLNNKNIYTLNFYQKENNKLKAPSMELKKMRGLYANYILKNNINNLADLKNININGYVYNGNLSNKNEYVYIKELS